MSKILKTNISPLNVPDWTPANAIRDLCQNALDAEAAFEYSYSNNALELTSKGVKLNPSVWVVGVSSKRNDPNSVGNKGEGLVLATQVLLRDGFNVTIINSDEMWVPSIKYSEVYETDCLEIEITNEGYSNDYTVLVEGVSEELWEQVVHDCLYLRDKDSLGNYVTAPCGSRVFYDYPNELYVGGLFVCTTNLQYSYDLHPSKIKLTRDRRECSGWDLQGVTASLLKEVAEPKRIVEAAQKDVADVHHMQYSWSVGSIPSEVADEAYSVFKLAYGDDAVVAESYSEMVRLQEQGFSKPVVVNDSFARLIRSSSDYETTFSEQEDALEVEEEKTPLELLEEWYDIDAPEYCEEFEKILDFFRERGLQYERPAKKKTVKGEFDDVQF